MQSIQILSITVNSIEIFETNINHHCPGERSWHCEINRYFGIPSDVISALSDVNKEIRFGAARAKMVSSFPRPATYIQTPQSHAILFLHILIYPISSYT